MKKLTKRRLFRMVKEELRSELQRLSEISYKEEQMANLVSRKPRLQRIQDNEGLDLKTLWDREVRGDHRLEQDYRNATDY
jgi:hypothetical protein